MKRSVKKKKKSPLRRFLILMIAIIGLLGIGVIRFAPNLVEQSYIWLYPLNYKDIVLKYSEKYEVDPYLMFALIRTESAFDAKAVSSAGAIGLAQIMPETGEWLAYKMDITPYSEDMLYIPDTNVEISCYYINMLIEKFGDTNTALAAYNAGMGNVSNWLQDSQYSTDGITLISIPFKETSDYVERINSALQVYRNTYPVLDYQLNS